MAIIRMTEADAARLGAFLKAQRSEPAPAKPAPSAARPRAKRERAAPDYEAIAAGQLRAAGLAAEAREHRFDPVRRWRFDFAWPSVLVALEIEGGIWLSASDGVGRHTSGAGYRGDLEKYNAASLAGWLVIRTDDRLLKTGQALAWVEAALDARGWRPPAGG